MMFSTRSRVDKALQQALGGVEAADHAAGLGKPLGEVADDLLDHVGAHPAEQRHALRELLDLVDLQPRKETGRILLAHGEHQRSPLSQCRRASRTGASVA
jgi:hypothetical protein